MSVERAMAGRNRGRGRITGVRVELRVMVEVVAMGDESTEQGRRAFPLRFGPSFRSIFESHREFVCGVLRRLHVPSADCPDLCQEVFVVVHRKLHEYDGHVPLRTWIFGICMRTASAHRRNARVRREEPCARPELLPQLDASLENPLERNIDVRRTLAHAETLLSQLDDAKRRVFVLHDIEGLPMAAVANELGCPLQTAYSRLHAARKTVNDRLARRRSA
jgi:RNA polymerase sigma-70 factor (ECF subfamily)